jgi:hypothetical protein
MAFVLICKFAQNPKPFDLVLSKRKSTKAVIPPKTESSWPTP